MKLFVLDTNIYLNYLNKGDKCFSKIVNHYFSISKKGDCIFYLPTVSFWEISRKLITGKLTIKNYSPYEAMKLIQKPVEELENFRDLPLSRKAASLAPTFSNKLPDPFDQLIVASAIDANLPLITKDTNIQALNLIRTVAG